MAKLYLAYGSNLNLSQMAVRCPDARQLGAMYIPYWRLVFRHVADIEPSRSANDLLPVGLWEITKECEEALDFYEGVPNLYKKIMVNGIMTYQMNRTNTQPPSRGYFHSILEGYKDFGLDNKHLFDALGWSHFLDANQMSWSQPRVSKKKFNHFNLHQKFYFPLGAFIPYLWLL